MFQDCKNFSAALLLPLLAMLLTACRSDLYYQSRAADRARAFLLREATELTPLEREFIRYNDPVLLIGEDFSYDTEMQSQSRQICVTWQLPERKELYMVYGFSGGRMDDWYPKQLLRKNYQRPSPPLANITELARKYAIDNLYDELAGDQFISLRFSPPYLLRTNFELNFDPEGKLTAEEKEKLQERVKERIQYTLVWKFGKKDLIFSGLASPGLGGWSVMLAGWMPDEELQKHTLKVSVTPEHFLDPLPPEDRAPQSKK